MKAMIMAAGVGSRLMPLTVDIPKPMVSMGNRPLIDNIVQVIARGGITDVIANLHYHPDVISGFLWCNAYNMSINFSAEKELMGTAGGVRRCQWFLDDTFVVMSGDGLTDIDLNRLVSEHKKRGAIASIALKTVADVEQYGVVVTEESGQIRAFQEKPRRAEAISNLANTGIYVFEPEIFNYIPPHQFYDFGKQVFPELVKLGAPFYGINCDCYWCDVGNLDTYLQAHYDILDGLCRYEPVGLRYERLSEGARFVIGAECDIDGSVSLKGRTTIGERCIVQRDSIINDSVLWSNTMVEKHAVINRAVVGAGCQVGEGSFIEPGAVIASGCVLPPKTRVPARTRVFRQGNEQVMVAG